MAIDPDTFEAEKYVEHFPKLQQAYKNAFTQMNEQYDSTLIHGIDQAILNESEPVYEGDGEFRIDLPADPHGRIDGVVVVDDERLDELLERYVETLISELQRVFDVE